MLLLLVSSYIHPILCGKMQVSAFSSLPALLAHSGQRVWFGSAVTQKEGTCGCLPCFLSWGLSSGLFTVQEPGFSRERWRLDLPERAGQRVVRGKERLLFSVTAEAL